MSTEEFLDQAETVRLDEMSRDEFRDATRRLRPDYTEAQINRSWLEFQTLKSVALATGSEFLWQ